MYTSYIGKKFLDIYNKKEQKNLSAKEFFNSVFFPIFFNDEKYLMHVENSPFFQPLNKEEKKLVSETNSIAQIKLNKLHDKIVNDLPNGSIYVGYAASNIKSTTTGQISVNYTITSEEMYCSWIGQALAIGVKGGNILIDNEELLYKLYFGWKYYREFLNQTSNLKDKQIETWNGHWLQYVFSNKFNSNNIQISNYIELKKTENILSIPTQSWVKIIFILSKKFPEKDIIAYSYILEKTNKTFGFIKIFLPKIKTIYELRNNLFFNKNIFEEQIEELEPFYNYSNACKLGTIGLKALEPKGLRAFMPCGTYKYSQGKEYKISDEKTYNNYSLYILWIKAMLNKTELLDLAEKIATSLIEYEEAAKPESRGKTTIYQTAIKLLESKNVKSFIENITEAMENQPRNAELFKQTIQEVLIMPYDNFPLFITLIKFKYTYFKISKEIK